MVVTVESGRIYLPAEDPNKPNDRIVVHPETNVDQIIVDQKGTHLRDYIGKQTFISQTQPERTNVFWNEITQTRMPE
jgi:hypothetical protein